MARLRTKSSSTSGRGKRASTVPADTAPGKAGSQAQDTFYRDLVWSMRNGVVAVRRDGRVAVINGEAYRILGLKPEATDIGRPYTDVLGPCHDVAQILSTAFKLNYLPNRAELRLKTTGKVIGYTLSLIRDGNKRTTAGAALFFKDLTRVEQLEERERLRDRLAALGEMAAAIAHEVRNPLAGIQVMAGSMSTAGAAAELGFAWRCPSRASATSRPKVGPSERQGKRQGNGWRGRAGRHCGDRHDGSTRRCGFDG